MVKKGKKKTKRGEKKAAAKEGETKEKREQRDTPILIGKVLYHSIETRHTSKSNEWSILGTATIEGSGGSHHMKKPRRALHKKVPHLHNQTF